jgi:hypothetical protein
MPPERIVQFVSRLKSIEKKSASLVTDWHFNIHIECLSWQVLEQALLQERVL